MTPTTQARLSASVVIPGVLAAHSSQELPAHHNGPVAASRGAFVEGRKDTKGDDPLPRKRKMAAVEGNGGNSYSANQESNPGLQVECGKVECDQSSYARS